MLGAYFGSTKIIQGAAGLGQQDELRAYADGVFGRGDRGDAETPGALFAFHDGSLGTSPLQAYADGSVGGAYDSTDGSLTAWDNGVFGSRPAVEYEAGGGGGSSDGGSLGPGAGGGGEMADHPEAVQAYQDGVFGGRSATCGLGDESTPNTYEGDTPISVLDNGILGRPFGVEDRMYGGLRSFHDGSLGAAAVESTPAAAAGVTLDLGDAATLVEVKSLLLLLSGTAQQTMQQIADKLPAGWLDNGIWDATASQLWQLFVSINPNFKGLEVSQMVGDQVVPNARALLWLVGMMVAPTKDAPGIDWAKKSIPNLYSWFAAGGGPVLPPYLTTADKAKDLRGGTAQAGMSAGKMAMWGLGAAALLGVALVMTKKR